jgi:hypothetical protein
VPLANGKASLTMNSLADGDHSVVASFAGGTLIRPSSSNALIERVVPPSGPFTRVLSPNDGETWRVGAAASIQWDASSRALAPVVSIYLARSLDFDWQPIAVDVPNSGSYTWTVTGPGTNVGSTEVASASVMVVDESGEVGADESDLPFSIIDATTAAIVTRLDAETADFGIRVTWALSGGAEFATVELQRAPVETGPWLAVVASRRDEAGVTIAEDRTAELGATYWYRLVGTTSAGATSVFGPVKGSAGAPREFSLSAAWPNPSRGAVACEFTVAQSAPVRLDVLDLQGRERSVLAQGNYAPGRYRVQWDGAEAGVALPAGVYFVRYVARGRSYVSRVALVR